MSHGIGRELIEKIRGAPPAEAGRPREVEVERGGVRIRADVRGSDRYGCEIDRIRATVPGGAPGGPEAGRAVRKQAERLAGRAGGLPEHLKAHEIDEGEAVGVLRSRPEEMRGRRYTEVRLKGGGEAEVERYEYRPAEGRRAAIPQGFTHDALERFADDLGEAMGKGEG